MNTHFQTAGSSDRTAGPAAVTVCDSEYTYALRLQEYLQGREIAGRVDVFSSRALLERSLREAGTDRKGILVIAEREYRAGPVDWDPQTLSGSGSARGFAAVWPGTARNRFSYAPDRMSADRRRPVHGPEAGGKGSGPLYESGCLVLPGADDRPFF